MTTTTPRRPVLRSVAQLAVIAVLSLAGMYLLMRFALHSYTGRWWDTQGMYVIGGNGDQFNQTQRFLWVISVPSMAVVLAVCVIAALLQNRWAVAAAIPVMYAGASVTTQVLKDYVFHTVTGGLNTLPSGHSTSAMVMAMAVVWAVPRMLRPYAMFFAAWYAGAVGMATVAAHWHRPSDVYAAAAVCLAWLAVGAAILLLVRGGRQRVGRPGRHLLAALLAMPLTWAFFLLVLRYNLTGPTPRMYLFDAFVLVTVPATCMVLVAWAAVWADRFDPMVAQSETGALDFGDKNQANQPAAPNGISATFVNKA